MSIISYFRLMKMFTLGIDELESDGSCVSMYSQEMGKFLSRLSILPVFRKKNQNQELGLF